MKKFKDLLLEEKSTLEGELASIARKDETTSRYIAVPEKQEVPEADENDLATRTENFEERSALVESLGKRLDDVQKALDKIENGGYGKCQKCGSKIEEDRLEANPAAERCMGCMNTI